MICQKELQYAMRRAGQNPTDVEVAATILKDNYFSKQIKVHDMINKIDDGSGVLNFEDFQMVRQICFEIFWNNNISLGD